MAEGYLRRFLEGKAIVRSAGVEAHGVNPLAIAVMKEDGVDISGHTSNVVDEYLSVDFDFVITVCDNAKERCPVFPGKAVMLHRDFPDPAAATGTMEEVLEQFRETRDLIKAFCRDFVLQHVDGRS
jgi:arsenate reductase